VPAGTVVTLKALALALLPWLETGRAAASRAGALDPDAHGAHEPIVNSCVCGFRWPSRIAPAVALPLNRKTFSPSPMFVSWMKLLYQ
jgi:hypothetical protein